MAHFGAEDQRALGSFLLVAGCLLVVLAFVLAVVRPPPSWTPRAVGTVAIYVLFAAAIGAAGWRRRDRYRRLRRLEEAGIHTWASIVDLSKTTERRRHRADGPVVPLYRIVLRVTDDDAVTGGYRVPSKPAVRERHAVDMLPPSCSGDEVRGMLWQVRVHPDEPELALIDWELPTRSIDSR